MKKKCLFVSVFLNLCHYCSAQKKVVIIDEGTHKPLEFANVVILKEKKGFSSNRFGEINWNQNNLLPSDTILISYVGYRSRHLSFNELISTDSIALKPAHLFLPEVVLQASTNVSAFSRKVVYGYFKGKFNGALYMRPGEQVGLKIIPVNNREAILTSIRLHFDELLPNCQFRLRIKNINPVNEIGYDLINGITINPTQLKFTLSLREYKIFLPLQGLFIQLDYLGNGQFFENKMDAPYIKIKLTGDDTNAFTYTNYMDAYKWQFWNNHLPNQKNPQNVQIQVHALSK